MRRLTRLTAVPSLLLPLCLAPASCRLAAGRRCPPPAAGTAPLFEDRTEAAGIGWKLGHGGKTPLTILQVMGTGCAVLDFDGDRWDDLFLIGQRGTGSTGGCALYRNRGGTAFEDVTRGSGLDALNRLPAGALNMGCATADWDNDGRIDLYVSGYGVSRLFRNAGGGRFEDVTARAGLEVASPTEWLSAAAFGDFDRDGWADLYVGRYVAFDARSRQFCDTSGVSSSCPPLFYPARTGRLYRNRGNGTFADVTVSAGLTGQHGKTLGALFADLDGDGWPELYLGNDAVPCDLYRNVRGRFRSTGMASGTAFKSGGQVQSGMGVDAADCNGDGRPELVVTTFQGEPTSLYVNAGKLRFEYGPEAAGLAAATGQTLGFGVRLADFDNDGRPDMAIANGHVVDQQEKIDRLTSYRQPLQLFRNAGAGQFVEETAAAGPGFTTPAVGRGLATGDFNRDGLVDLIAIDLEGRPRLLINRSPAQNHWADLRLVGSPSNRLGLGATVRVTSEAGTAIQECRTCGSYFSASSPVVHFGLGTAAGLGTGAGKVRALVRWPSGRETALSGLSPDASYTVQEGRGLIRSDEGGRSPE